MAGSSRCFASAATHRTSRRSRGPRRRPSRRDFVPQGLPWSLPWSYPVATLELGQKGRQRGPRATGDDEAWTSGGPLGSRAGWRWPRRRTWAGYRVIGLGDLARSRVSPQKPRGPNLTKYEKNVQIRKWFWCKMSLTHFFPYKSFFGNYFRDTEPSEPGFRPDLGRRVHEEAENASKASNCGAQASASLNCSIFDCSLLRVLPYEHNS